MKFIVLLSLIVLSLSTTVIDKKWCGNSKVDVEIVTLKGDKQLITKASITVPNFLQQLSNFKKEQKELIAKTEQGLILTLDGKAEKEHLGVIYNYDEDDNTQIFIPYLYISAINQNFNKFNVIMSRTFKGNKNFIFDIIPVPDAFGTDLCPCQRVMFSEKIKNNLMRRISVLTSISTEIVNQFNNIDFYNSEIKKWKSVKPDTTLVNSLIKQRDNKEKECKQIDLSIVTLNASLLKSGKEKNEANIKSIGYNENIQALTQLIKEQKIEIANKNLDKSYYDDARKYCVLTKDSLNLLKENFNNRVTKLTEKITTISGIQDKINDKFDKDFYTTAKSSTDLILSEITVLTAQILS